MAVVTGSRAEFGLLEPIMHAIAATPGLELGVIATGTHMLRSGLTFRDVRRAFPGAIAVPMQVDGRRTRADDAEALGHGIARLSRVLRDGSPAWVVVLGDRIEAFAAAAAASVAGIAVAHVHGGDRAEGIADEAMRHAITKLAHLHFPATPASARRIVRMGERPEHVLTVGSPALDGLAELLGSHDAAHRPSPRTMVLLHPAGLTPSDERAWAGAIVRALAATPCEPGTVMLLAPNHDPGRQHIADVWEQASREHGWELVEHLPRASFVRALAGLARASGVLIGNSSAGLIEAAALPGVGCVGVVNVGPRQAGRERFANVVDVQASQPDAIAHAIGRARSISGSRIEHTLGDGRAGHRIAQALASVDPLDPVLLRKRCAY